MPDAVLRHHSRQDHHAGTSCCVLLQSVKLHLCSRQSSLHPILPQSKCLQETLILLWWTGLLPSHNGLSALQHCICKRLAGSFLQLRFYPTQQRRPLVCLSCSRPALLEVQTPDAQSGRQSMHVPGMHLHSGCHAMLTLPSLQENLFDVSRDIDRCLVCAAGQP